MNECTCAQAICESERRKADLREGLQLFPQVVNFRGTPDGRNWRSSTPIFEEKVDG